MTYEQQLQELTARLLECLLRHPDALATAPENLAERAHRAAQRALQLCASTAGANDTPHQAERFFTVAELAEFWGVSKNHVRRLIWRGELQATRLGRSMRISSRVAERFTQTSTP